MTQLTDKIREAIIGNVGTVISGRIGTTDAELMVKRFQPTFDAEDLTRLPNFETIASVMIHNVPSQPFSMSLLPPLGTPNDQLAKALKRLSAAKYGRPRAIVEKEIFARLRAGDEARDKRRNDTAISPSSSAGGSNGTGSSFLDEWLAKRKKLENTQPAKPIASAPALSKTEQPKQAYKSSGSLPKSDPVKISQPAKPAPNKPVSLPKQPMKPKEPDVATDKTAQKPEFRDNRLQQLQNRGMGDSLSIKQHKVQPSSDMALSDAHNLDAHLHEVRQKGLEDEKQNSDPTTLKINKDSRANLDEIYIDLRGNLHHKNGEDDEIIDSPTVTPNLSVPPAINPPAPKVQQN